MVPHMTWGHAHTMLGELLYRYLTCMVWTQVCGLIRSTSSGSHSQRGVRTGYDGSDEVTVGEDEYRTSIARYGSSHHCHVGQEHVLTGRPFTIVLQVSGPASTRVNPGSVSRCRYAPGCVHRGSRPTPLSQHLPTGHSDDLWVGSCEWCVDVLQHGVHACP